MLRIDRWLCFCFDQRNICTGPCQLRRHPTPDGLSTQVRQGLPAQGGVRIHGVCVTRG
jgi:hypothetical protein